MKSGVNFFGPFDALDSIGRASALNIQCLEEVGIPYDVHLLSRPGPVASGDYTAIDDQFLSKVKYRFNLFHFNARRVPLYFSRLGEDSLSRFYNIGYWVHEMPTIPSHWARQLDFFNEIWTPSSICQSAIAKSSKIPVLRIPHPVDFNSPTPRILQMLAGRIFPTFNFLAVFDVLSDAERKNPLFLLRAFLNAHGGNHSVRLIIKTLNLVSDPVLETCLKNASKQHANVVLYDGYLGRDAFNNLYNQADAFVSLHRAEGFGLAISDALSRGIPVIATGYSGNMDFCNTDVRVVAYNLRQVGHNRPRYRSEDEWAEPDLEDATAAFSELVREHAMWLRRAARARSRIHHEFSIQKVGAMMRDRLTLIEGNFSFPDDMSGRWIDQEVGIFETYGF